MGGKQKTWIEKEREMFQDVWQMTYEEAERKLFNDLRSGVWVKQGFMNSVSRMAYMECCWKETGNYPQGVE